MVEGHEDGFEDVEDGGDERGDGVDDAGHVDVGLENLMGVSFVMDWSALCDKRCLFEGVALMGTLWERE